MKEGARRAGIHEKTFQNSTHRETTRERVRNWIYNMERRLSSGDCRAAKAAGREPSETERLKSDLEEALANLKAAKENLNNLWERYAKLARHMNMMFHKARQKARH
jgi:hypothetical protein